MERSLSYEKISTLEAVIPGRSVDSHTLIWPKKALSFPFKGYKTSILKGYLLKTLYCISALATPYVNNAPLDQKQRSQAKPRNHPAPNPS